MIRRGQNRLEDFSEGLWVRGSRERNLPPRMQLSDRVRKLEIGI